MSTHDASDRMNPVEFCDYAARNYGGMFGNFLRSTHVIDLEQDVYTNTSAGVPLKQGMIAPKLGTNRQYISGLIHGKEDPLSEFFHNKACRIFGLMKTGREEDLNAFNQAYWTFWNAWVAIGRPRRHPPTSAKRVAGTDRQRRGVQEGGKSGAGERKGTDDRPAELRTSETEPYTQASSGDDPELPVWPDEQLPLPIARDPVPGQRSLLARNRSEDAAFAPVARPRHATHRRFLLWAAIGLCASALLAAHFLLTSGSFFGTQSPAALDDWVPISVPYEAVSEHRFAIALRNRKTGIQEVILVPDKARGYVSYIDPCWSPTTHQLYYVALKKSGQHDAWYTPLIDHGPASSPTVAGPQPLSPGYNSLCAAPA